MGFVPTTFRALSTQHLIYTTDLMSGLIERIHNVIVSCVVQQRIFVTYLYVYAYDNISKENTSKAFSP